MMKKSILFIFLWSSSMVLACKCHIQSFGENFAQNDFVAEIEILKKYDVDFKTAEEDRFYKADIKILKLYKGQPITSIFVKGKIGKTFGPACEIELHPGERFLVYLNSEGELGMSSCTPRKLLTDPKIDLERQAIQFLIAEDLKDTNIFYFSGDFFENYKNLIPKNQFAVYQLKVDPKSRIENIKALQNFGTNKDSEIMDIIKTKFTILRDMMSEVRNEEVTLILFFDKDNRGVISNFNSPDF